MPRKITLLAAVFQFVLFSTVFANSLIVTEQGDVIADTDRYLIIFKKGIPTHFHNKLTRETYTDASVPEGVFRDNGTVAFVGFIEDSVFPEGHIPEIRRNSPTSVEIIYESENLLRLHMFLEIESETGDFIIRQRGFAPKEGAEKVIWTYKNLAHKEIDLIIPARGGIVIGGNEVDQFQAPYPGMWEAQLAIFQGKRGGFFVRGDDTEFHFKQIEYRKADGYKNAFAVSFTSTNFAPFIPKKEVEGITWRLNAYQGDWKVPTLIYRDWMRASFPSPNRNAPAWVDDIECVIKNHGDLDIEKLERLNQLVDPSKTLIYIYWWHEDGGDPPHRRDGLEPNFVNFLNEARRYGFKTMVHTAMSHIPTNHPIYEEFEEYHVRHPYSGEKIGYKLNDPTYPTPAATINSASSAFRNMALDELTFIADTRVDAIHLDFSISVINDQNGRIEGLTMAEGIDLLNQGIREAIPDIVLSGESITELSAPYNELAQRWYLPEGFQPHPVSSFLFSPQTRFYGHLGYPNPDRNWEKFQSRQEEYDMWGVLPTITVWDIHSLDDDKIETQKLLKLVRQRQGYLFGDVNDDLVVNILDLVLISRSLGENEPHLDINKDGVINILDLVVISQNL